MKKELRRVHVRNDQEFRKLLEDLRADRIPRLIEEDGEPVAIVLDPSDYDEARRVPKSKINEEKIRSLIGSWSDLDVDELIADIHRWREEAPPSPDPSHYFEDPEKPSQ